jgi:hypothetical protein
MEMLSTRQDENIVAYCIAQCKRHGPRDAKETH